MRKLMLTVAAFAAGVAFATDYVWTGGAGTASWSTPANWGVESGYPSSDADKATFETAGDVNVTLDTGVETPICRLTVLKGKVTLSGTSGSSLKFHAPSGSTAAFDCRRGATLVFELPITGTQRVDRYREGTVLFHNSYYSTHSSYPLISCCGTNIIEGTASFNFPNGTFYVGMVKDYGYSTVWPFYIRDQAKISAKRINYAGGGAVPTIQIIQDGADTEVNVADELQLVSAIRSSDEHAYILKNGKFVAPTVEIQCSTNGDHATEHFIVEGGQATVGTIELASASAALKGGLLKLDKTVQARTNCSLNVYGGTLALTAANARPNGSRLPGVRWLGRFSLTNTYSNASSRYVIWDFNTTEIGPDACFVIDCPNVLNMQHHVSSFGMPIEIVTNQTLQLPSPNRNGRANTTITAPAGTYEPWKVKIDKGASIKLVDSTARLSLPLALTIEDGGTINMYNHGGFAVAHTLTVGGVALDKGRYLTGDVSWLVGGAQSSVVVPYVWTGAAGDGNWATAENWEGGVVPPNAGTTCVDLSQAKSVTLNSDIALGCLVAMPNDCDRTVTIAGTGKITFSDATDGVTAIYVNEERDLVLDVDVARADAKAVVIQGGGKVTFKKSVPGPVLGDTKTGYRNIPAFLIDGEVEFNGITDFDKSGSGDYGDAVMFNGQDTYTSGKVTFGGDSYIALISMAISPGSWPSRNYAGTALDEFRMTSGSLTITNLYVTRHNDDTSHNPCFYFEGGTLTVVSNLYVGGNLTDWSGRTGSRFEMTGGTLKIMTATVVGGNTFEANGGTIVQNGGSGLWSASGTSLVGFKLGGVTLQTSTRQSGVWGEYTHVYLTGVNGNTVIDSSAYYYYVKSKDITGPGGLTFYRRGSAAGDTRIRSELKFTGDFVVDGGTVHFEKPESKLNGPRVLRTRNGGVIRFWAESSVLKSPDVIDLGSSSGLTFDDAKTMTVKRLIIAGVEQPAGTYEFGKGTVTVSAQPESWVDDEGNGDLSYKAGGATTAVSDDLALNSLKYISASGSGTNTLTVADGKAITFNDGATIDVSSGSVVIINGDVILGGKVTKIGTGKIIFNGKVNAPDGVDFTKAGTDVYWFTVNHGTASFDGAVKGVRLVTASSDGDMPCITLEKNCTVSDYAFVLTAYTEGSEKVYGETIQNGATVNYAKMTKDLLTKWGNVCPMTHSNSGYGRYTLNGGTFKSYPSGNLSWAASSSDSLTFDIVQNGGEFHVMSGFYFARCTSGVKLVYALNDGELHIHSVFAGFDSSMDFINFNGGDVYFYYSSPDLNCENFTCTVNGDVAFHTVAGNASSVVIGADFSGDGKISFAGPGTFQLTGNYLLPQLAVTGGTLTIGEATASYVSTASVFNIAAGSVLKLDFDGMIEIDRLYSGDTQLPRRTYWAGKGTAYDSLFAGKGKLKVNNPIRGMLVIIR